MNMSNRRKQMTVYIEFVIIDNFVIDLLILLLTKSLLKIQTRKIFLLLSTIFGTVVAVVSPLLPSIIAQIIKIPLTLSMVLIAYRPKTIKEFLAQTITFLISTFAMIGCCLAISQIFKIEVSVQNGMIMEYKFPVGAVLLICFVVFVSLKNIFKLILKKQKFAELSYSIILKNENKQIETMAFLDTGNKLVINEKPITIIGYKTFFELFPNIDITKLLLSKNLNLKNAKYIETKSVNKNNKSLVFEIDEIVVNKVSKTKMPVLLSTTNFLKETGCDVVISGAMIV